MDAPPEAQVADDAPARGNGRRRGIDLKGLLSPGDGPPFREIVASSGWYPLAILTSLNSVDELSRAVLGVFGPNLKRYFDIGNTELGALVGVTALALLVIAVPVGYLGTRVDRARILRWSAVVWSVFQLGAAFAVSLPLLALALIGVGAGKAAVEPVGRSLLTDYYPPNGWNRIIAVHNAANPIGGLLGPAIAAIIVIFVSGDGVWRWGFVAMTIPCVIALLATRRLREPENQMVRGVTGSVLTFTGAPSDLRFREAAGRLLRIPTFRRELVGIGVLGFGIIGLLAFFNVFLEEQHGVEEAGRGLIGVFIATASLLGTLVGGNVGERIFERSPRRAVSMVGASIAAFSVFLGFGVFLPNLWLFLPATWIAVLGLFIGAAPLAASLSAISPPRLRPLMFSLLGFFIALFGGISGGVIVGLVADATNIQWGLATLAPFGILGGLLMSRAGATIDDDIAAVEAEMTDVDRVMSGFGDATA